MEHKNSKLEFAFTKFKSQKYPVYAYSRVYTLNHRCSIHSHDFPQIWYCRTGRHIHMINGTTYDCPAGTLLILPPGNVHHFCVNEAAGAEILAMHINYELLLNMPFEEYMNAACNLFLSGFLDKLGIAFSPCITLSAASRKIVEECFSWVCLLSYKMTADCQPENICRKLEELFSVPELSLPGSIMRKARNLFRSCVIPIYRSVFYINRHYYEKINEEDVLKAGGISRSGFYRYFKCVVGCSYSQYLQQLRVRHAYIYLKFTNHTLSYIADVCGFCDTHHMASLFGKYIGSSPTNTRNYLRRLYNGVCKP